jgi:chromosome segregation protein
MHLRSITLKGFKSFPDRTRLDFDPGVSVVVGPNGSGKSNITDAVLWALGEQSPLAVRGQSMQDIIFGGAPGRQAARSAEVELVLDDSDGTLGLGSSEVSIVRRLDRTGEGEYRLAGARCRLVDVIELLSDTGLGKEMHSVISQGRVESIVTSKPQDRRLLIEEAAGLGKHRKRRRRAQLKLARTQENLDRALDVEREARSRLRPLKRQAEAADLHARLERQTLEATWELARDQLRAQREALAEAESTATDARERRQAVELALQDVASKREAAEEALASRSAHREQLSTRLFAARSAAERVAYRADAVRRAEHALEQRIASVEALSAKLEVEAGTEEPDDGAARRIDALEAELAALDHDREAALARQLAELEDQRQTASAQHEAEEANVARMLSERDAAGEQLEQAQAALRACERDVEAARRAAASVGGELAAVNQLLRMHAAARPGTSVLSDEIEVDPGFELAVAAVLDGRLGASIVGDRGSAAALLDRAGKDGGRVLVADSAREEAGPSQPPAPAAKRLAEHVRGSSTAAGLARALLASAWVVDDFADVARSFDGIAVTPAGRVWAPRGHELRQVPALGEGQVLAERNRREQLVVESESAAQAELAAGAALERAAENVVASEETYERAVAAHRSAVRARDEAAEAQRRIARLIEGRRAAPEQGTDADRRVRVTAELEAERRMQQRAVRERADRQRRAEQLRTTRDRDQALLPLVRKLTTALERAGAALSACEEEFGAALEADRRAGDHVADELRSCARAEAELHARLHQTSESLTAAEVSAQRVRDQAADAETELARVATILGLSAEPATEPLSEEDRAGLSARVERLGRRREQLGPVNPLAAEEYEAAALHVEELEGQRSDLETALRELEKLIDDTDRQIRVTFEETFDAAARNFEELATQLFPGGRGRLTLVAERDGPSRTLGGSEPVEDDENADEELVGVEIEITPAGKAMKRLTLLSGGEKSMTALAFLFAVFLARPCPFYILDEVEAALDDINIDRFLELLRRYSERAQFIVVTHQKRTIEAADSLYGVSMGADGISKIVSRRLPREEAA